MAKGLRLSFLGQHLNRDELIMMSSCLGFNTYPHFGGWGGPSHRNYLAFDSGKSYDICMCLVQRGIMSCEKAADTGRNYTYFHVTDFGKRIFDMFRRHHKHPRLALYSGHPRNKRSRK